MENQVFEKLKEFIVRERSEYDFELTRETDLQRDLKLWEDDADEFIEKFSHEFKVDVSELDMNKYFSQEGDRILSAIIDFFKGKKSELHSLTIGDLEKAVEKGKIT